MGKNGSTINFDPVEFIGILKNWRQCSSLTYNGDRSTTGVRIAGETGGASANGNVICHAALGVQSADAGARIDAAVVDAALLARTLRVDGALGPARDVRVSGVVGRAAALRTARRRIHHALSVRSARVRNARPRLLNHRAKNR